jgi:hypothetical protein
MLLRTLRTLPIAAASALSAFAFGGLPAAAEPAQYNLGPVGPNEPILATVGGKRLIAYYQPDGDNCEVSAVVFDVSPSGGGQASSRIRVSLHPGDLLFVDDITDRSVVLTCAPKAGMLTVLNRHELLTEAASVN